MTRWSEHTMGAIRIMWNFPSEREGGLSLWQGRILTSYHPPPPSSTSCPTQIQLHANTAQPPQFLLPILFEQRSDTVQTQPHNFDTEKNALKRCQKYKHKYGSVNTKCAQIQIGLALSKDNYVRWRQWQKGLTAMNLNSHG